MSPRLPAFPTQRLAAALAASVALHAGAAYVAEVTPRGAPDGRAPLLAQRLHVRILAAGMLSPEPRMAIPPDLGAQTPAELPETVAVAGPAAREPLAGPPAVPRTGEPLGLREGPLYFLPSQLDARPWLLTRVEPVYPRGAPPDGGYVLMRLLINERGTVDRAIVVASDPSDKFGEAAVEAFSAAQYSSGKLAGVAVKSQLLIEMRFNPIVPPGLAAAAPGR